MSIREGFIRERKRIGDRVSYLFLENGTSKEGVIYQYEN